MICVVLTVLALDSSKTYLRKEDRVVSKHYNKSAGIDTFEKKNKENHVFPLIFGFQIGQNKFEDCILSLISILL